MKKILSICLWALFVQTGLSIAQGNDAVLKQQLRGKQNLAEIMSTVKVYYSDPATVSRLGISAVNRYIKHWQRYEWYMSRRLGPNGEFVNINRKMIEATGIDKRMPTAAGKDNTASISTGSWVPVGPMNTDNGIGRADRLAFHPTDASTVYAGTSAGGLWKTTNAGTTWTNISPDLPAGGISGILIDPVNTNTIYILTGDGDSNFGGFVEDFGYIRLSIGVLKSTNGGANWIKTGDFPGADYNTLNGYRLVMHPSDPNILYACTNQGIYTTTNGGASWGLNIGGGRVFNMKFKPGSDNICYATSARPDFSISYFLRSTNSGLTWDTINGVMPQINNPTNRVELAVAPSNPSRVYLLAGGVPGNIPSNPVPNQFKGFFLSTDDGLTFTRQTNTPNILGRLTNGQDTVQQSDYDLAIAVSNVNSTRLVTGGVQVWRSSNSGGNFTYSGVLHDDVHDLGYHPADNKLWAATDGGVYSSEDDGASWTSHFETMNISQFYRMAVDPNDYVNILAGAQDNAVKKKVGATSFFSEIFCCDGFGVGYDIANSDILYAVNNRNINRSVDGGTNIVNITPAQVTAPFATSLAVHTSLANALFVGSDSIWRSTNNGTTWTASINIRAGWFLRTCPSNGNRVYAAGGTQYNSNTGILRRSDDGSVTWPNGNILSNHTGFPVNFPKITCINVDPTNSLRVWITFGGFTNNMKVFYADYNTNPAGLWVNMSGTLPNVPINCITLDNNNNAYLGTDNGVYYRAAGMSDWVPFYNNLPYVPVTDLIISEAENRIRAATFGRGIWSSELYSTCATDLNIAGTLSGQRFYEASNNISSTASILTSEGSKVQMRGGNEVKLQDGFSSREVTQFKASIGPCGGGGVAGFLIPENDSALTLSPQQYLPPAGGKRSLVHIISSANNEVQFEVDQKQNGNTDIILTDAGGKIISTKKFPVSTKGKWNNTISTAGLNAGLYYLYAVLDKRVEHMQELIISLQ
jgi:photosystem II stability/assembly factor-like uncharacterized protein